MTRLDLQAKPKLSLTTNLITSIELIALNYIELYSFIEKESENNVFIDYDVFIEDKMFRDYIRKNNKSSYDYFQNDEELQMQDNIKYEKSLKEYLLEQLGVLSLSEEELSAGKYIIYSIDDDGYFKLDISHMSLITGISENILYFMLDKIQSFEPAGIGAENLKQCLLLQIDKKDKLLYELIDVHLEDIYKNKHGKILSSLKIGKDCLNNYINIIKSLNPKPARGYSTFSYMMPYIYPDIVLEDEKGKLIAKIKEPVSNIHLNQYYLNMLESDIDFEAKEYLKKKLSRTLFLMDSIEKRRKTIQKVVNKIIELQSDFFIKDEPLKAMSLKDISIMLGISESTVSRAIKNKYIQTKKGMYDLKYFFSSKISTFDEDCISKDLVFNKIKEIVAGENPKKPLSDQKITDLLNQKGINIKRRTVSKYREELNISAAKNRKTL